MVAPAGAGPWPQITSARPLRTSNRTTGTSPPGPLRCGSTTWSVNAVAQAASKALPPSSRIDMPTAVAIQWVEVTTPNVPSLSGRVVKGFGLMLLIGAPFCGVRFWGQSGSSFRRFARRLRARLRVRLGVYHVVEFRTLPLWAEQALLGGVPVRRSRLVAGGTEKAHAVEADIHQSAADRGRFEHDLLGRGHHGEATF